MEKSPISPILAYFLLSLTFIPVITHAFSRSISREEVGLKEEKQTQLTFYFHDIVSGPNPTSIQIAKASTTAQSPSSFGALAMMDDPLTEGPDSNSTLVGRAQGLYALADQQETAPLMVMNLVFLEGDYNGSTLSVLGRNPVSDTLREMPVVGGTGAFRFAKGYAQAKTHTFDSKTGNAVVQYNVYVSHANTPSTTTDSGTTATSGSPGSTSSNHVPAFSQAFLSTTTMVSVFLTFLLYFSLC